MAAILPYTAARLTLASDHYAGCPPPNVNVNVNVTAGAHSAARTQGP